MAKQTINLGSTPNKGDGDPLRVAFDKVNDNFNELYAGNFASPEDTASNIIPSTDGVYDLGSFDKKWSTVHVDSFIYLNGARIEVTASGALLINGDAPAEVQDTVGSVFGDDSTLLVDGVNSVIPSANIAGIEAVRWNTAYNWGDHSTVGYALQSTTYTKTEVDEAIAAQQHLPVGDLVGSVFADDSTPLVDGVNGKIVGPVETTSIVSDTIVNDTYIQSSTVNADAYGANTIGNFINFGVNASSINVVTDIDMLTFDITNATNISATTFTGDLTGSVFADDSTVLVDGVNGKIVGNVDTSVVETNLIISQGGNLNATGATLIVSAANGTAQGGTMLVGGGVGTAGNGGSATLFGGPGSAGNGGNVSVTGGNGSAGDGGDASISAGAGSVDGGNVYISAGNGGSGTDGTVFINGNVSLGSLTSVSDFYGEIEFNNGTTSFQAGQTLSVNTNNFYASEMHGPVDGSLYLGGRTQFAKVNNLAMTASITYAQTDFEISNNSTLSFGAGSGIDFANATISGVDDLTVGTSLTVSDKTINTPDTSTGGPLSSTATALDVTKTLQVLNSADSSNDWWSLADGTEGQIMHFVPGSGTGTNQHKVTIANWRKWDDGAGVAGEWVVKNNLDWLPFKLDFDGNYWTGVATAIFTNGAWQTNNPWID